MKWPRLYLRRTVRRLLLAERHARNADIIAMRLEVGRWRDAFNAQTARRHEAEAALRLAQETIAEHHRLVPRLADVEVIAIGQRVDPPPAHDEA